MMRPCLETPHEGEIVLILRESDSHHTVRCLIPIVSFGENVLRTALWAALADGLVECQETRAGRLWFAP